MVLETITAHPLDFVEEISSVFLNTELAAFQ